MMKYFEKRADAEEYFAKLYAGKFTEKTVTMPCAAGPEYWVVAVRQYESQDGVTVFAYKDMPVGFVKADLCDPVLLEAIKAYRAGKL